MKPNHSPVITGLGVISAAGYDLNETRATLRGSKAPLDLNSDLPFFQVPLLSHWNSSLGLSTADLKVNIFSLVAVHEALQSAGLDKNSLSKMRVGVCLGSTVGCSNFQEQFSNAHNLGQFPEPSPFLAHFRNNLSQFISRSLGVKGPVLMVSNACTSGADAIGIAASWLSADLCDLVICGGAEVILPQIYFGFKSMLLCSLTLCTPFDKDRQGLTLGEGAGILILEKSSSPRAKNAKICLRGYGSASDAYHPTAPHPEGHGLAAAVHVATRNLEDLSSIDFVNAHGTATPHNDLAEGRWIQRHLSGALTVATKGYTGHCLAAAGAIEAIFTVLALQENFLPASKGFAVQDPEIGISPTQEIHTGNYTSALSFSLGFGGTNSVLYLGHQYE